MTMPNVRIRQLNERVASCGVFLTSGPGTRKLMPGEVVAVEDVKLLKRLANLLEVTLDPVTRPLQYDTTAGARMAGKLPLTEPLEPVADLLDDLDAMGDEGTHVQASVAPQAPPVSEPQVPEPELRTQAPVEPEQPVQTEKPARGRNRNRNGRRNRNG